MPCCSGCATGAGCLGQWSTGADVTRVTTGERITGTSTTLPVPGPRSSVAEIVGANCGPLPGTNIQPHTDAPFGKSFCRYTGCVTLTRNMAGGGVSDIQESDSCGRRGASFWWVVVAALGGIWLGRRQEQKR